MQEDIIEYDGQLVPTTDGPRRQGLVQQINAAAETGHRTQVGDGAWVARHNDLIVSELPTLASEGQPGAPIIIGVFIDTRSRRVMVDDLVAGLTAFGHKVGYELDAELARHAMEEVVGTAGSAPFQPERWSTKSARWMRARGAAAFHGLRTAISWLGSAWRSLRTRIRALFTR
jgi:hypothetical protein